MSTSYLNVLRTAWAAHLAPLHCSSPGVVSLFSGGGGSLLGCSMAGYRPLLAVEQDPHALDTLRLNFPGLALHCGDIRDLGTAQALSLAGVAPGELDLLEGSPPCQGISRGGKRQARDPRNELWQEFARLVNGFQPKAFVMENVDTLLTGGQASLAAQILGRLQDCGYQVGAWLLNAANFQVPQHRVRTLVLGLRRDLQLLPAPPRPQSWPRPVAEALWDLPVAPCPNKGHWWVDESPAGRNTRTWHLAAAAPQGARYAGYQRRLRWLAPAPTLCASHAQGRDKRPYLRSVHCHPLWTRTLTPLEYRRLSSFPDGYRLAGETDPKTWHQSLSRVGNAVPPLFMCAVATALRGQLREAARHG